ncbi:MAG: glycosyltransferase family 4 protein [Methanosarcina sp.]|jgi:glycosyltransferase involved in cell wall biosynthesis|nr:glycosyltransferase family 4 protein [Methanosarcina sp.]MDD4523078.1 glycosyltransferase family 4 protein [Methanosarcina sp.]HHV24574.1 glycosyltransferase family 4 protein [Methanosarcina sp.]
MKILQITLDTKGGMIHYVSQLSNALALNNDVSVIIPIGAEADLFNSSVKIVPLHTGNIIRNFIINTLIVTRMVQFYKTIQRIHPDIIHLQLCNPWICLFLPILRNYKIVTTIHDVEPHIGSREVDQKIARDAHIKFSDCIIVHGNKAKSILEKKAINKKVYSVPHGDYSFFTKITRDDYHEEEGTILFFGRIVEYKGLKYLIQAAPKIFESIRNIKIIIAGSGSLDEYKDTINSPHFEIYNNFIHDNDVGKYFQRASVVVLPYIECTQTGVIPIAYAFKKPVVVTNVGSIPEVVDDGITGYIVPPKDPNSLAEAIIKILGNENLRKKMGENAYKKMNEELSWDSIAKKTIKIYEEILEPKNENN